MSTTTTSPAKAEVKSSPTLSTMTEKVEIPEATNVAAPSQCAIACTSVWDLRRPDGTAYTHEQLLAAAAILGEGPLGVVDPTGAEGNRSHGEAGGIGRVGGWARLCSIVFAMLASGFLVIDRLLGTGMEDEMRHEPSLLAMVRKLCVHLPHLEIIKMRNFQALCIFFGPARTKLLWLLKSFGCNFLTHVLVYVY